MIILNEANRIKQHVADKFGLKLPKGGLAHSSNFNSPDFERYKKDEFKLFDRVYDLTDGDKVRTTKNSKLHNSINMRSSKHPERNLRKKALMKRYGDKLTHKYDKQSTHNVEAPKSNGKPLLLSAPKSNGKPLSLETPRSNWQPHPMPPKSNGQLLLAAPKVEAPKSNGNPLLLSAPKSNGKLRLSAPKSNGQPRLTTQSNGQPRLTTKSNGQPRLTSPNTNRPPRQDAPNTNRPPRPEAPNTNRPPRRKTRLFDSKPPKIAPNPKPNGSWFGRNKGKVALGIGVGTAAAYGIHKYRQNKKKKEEEARRQAELASQKKTGIKRFFK